MHTHCGPMSHICRSQSRKLCLMTSPLVHYSYKYHTQPSFPSLSQLLLRQLLLYHLYQFLLQLLSPTSPTTISPASRCVSPVVNKLVAAGLINPDLMDILATPGRCCCGNKKKSKTNYWCKRLKLQMNIERLREDKQRKEEAEEEIKNKGSASGLKKNTRKKKR